MSIILGLGVLGIPWALGTLGWGVGLTALLLSAGGGIYSGLTISTIVGIASQQGVPPKRYGDPVGAEVVVKVPRHGRSSISRCGLSIFSSFYTPPPVLLRRLVLLLTLPRSLVALMIE